MKPILRSTQSAQLDRALILHRLHSARRWTTASCLSMLALVACGESVRGEEIITDEFSTSLGITEAGGTFEPGVSKGGTKWLVESGRVASNGSPLPYESPAGQLVLDRTAETKLRLDFGSVKNDTPAKVSFQLRQWDGAGASTAFFVMMSIGCKELGAEYGITISLSPAYFGAKEGGMSGVGISDSGGANGGVADAQFPVEAAGQSFHEVTIKFDPAEGTTVYLDEQLIGSLGNTDGLPKIDYFTIKNGGDQRLSWLVDNFSVDATLN